MYLKLITSLLLLLIIGFINGLNTESSSMECYSDSDYINSWDAVHNNIQTNYFLSGQYSYHNNFYEDRLYKWTYCKPTSLTSFTDTTTLTQTSWDAEWTQSCDSINNGIAAMYGVVSEHNNYYEDRLFTMYCASLDSSIYTLENCEWSDQLNNYDGVLDYDCPDNGVIRS